MAQAVLPPASMLFGVANATFSAAADFSAAVPLVGSSSLSLSASGVMNESAEVALQGAAGFTIDASATLQGDAFFFPAAGDWTDHGVVVDHGAGGAWDRYMFGMSTPCSVVKQGNTYFLYYLGGDEHDGAGGDARNRALGVATATSLLGPWTPYAGNPIITFQPNGDWEEGVSAAGACLDPSGNVVLYYNGLTWIGGNQVNSDIRMRESSDGINFGSETLLIAHDDPVDGAGDEIWPVAAFRNGSTYWVYYSGDLWNLYVAEFSNKSTLIDTDPVLDTGTRHFGCSAITKDGTNLAIPVAIQSFGTPWKTTIRSAPTSAPMNISSELELYDLGNGSYQTFFYNILDDKWYMFYQTSPGDVDETEIGVMSADG